LGTSREGAGPGRPVVRVRSRPAVHIVKNDKHTRTALPKKNRDRTLPTLGAGSSFCQIDGSTISSILTISWSLITINFCQELFFILSEPIFVSVLSC